MTTVANSDVFGWRWGSDVADVNSQSYLAGDEVSLEISQAALDDTTFYLRIGIENDGDMDSTGAWTIQVENFTDDPGTWTTVTTSSVDVQIRAGQEDDATAVTTHDIVGGAGSDVNGEFDDGDGSIDSNILGGENADLVWAIAFQSADFGSGGQTVNFRVRSGMSVISDDTAGVTCTIESASADLDLTPNVVALDIAAQNPTANLTLQVDATSQALNIAAQVSDVDKNLSIDATSQALNISSQNATVNLSLEITAALQALDIASHNVTVVKGINLAPAAIALNIAAHNPGVNATREIAATSQALNIASQNATVQTVREVAVLLVALNIQGFDPTVDLPGGGGGGGVPRAGMRLYDLLYLLGK